MSGQYILAIDQSTQGTKALLFDRQCTLVARADRAHAQHVNENGWVEHDPQEILENTLAAAKEVVETAGIKKDAIAAMGISNQRETVMAWDRVGGVPLHSAIVWQCARAKGICEGLDEHKDEIKTLSGLHLSPYFSAAKLTWLLENVPAVAKSRKNGTLCCGTMDSFLIYSLTEERAFKTDYSNASRTQLFNIHTLRWDDRLCQLYRVPKECLPEVSMSDALFGHTTLNGFLEAPIPICGVLGDSHGALLGQNCRIPGSIKATYGTGSSVMMHTGATPIESTGGLVTSLAWGLFGKVEYVLEGNLNYTGAVISWLRQNAELLSEDAECEALARAANSGDHTYFVPAFTGLGAPYWDSKATGLLTGITRTTGRAEIVKAALDCIAYQITDLVALMRTDAGLPTKTLQVDGGPTKNAYLMQLQSDLTGAVVKVPQLQELSGMGAACAAGFSVGLYDPQDIYPRIEHTAYTPNMKKSQREQLYTGWKQAVAQALTHP